FFAILRILEERGLSPQPCTAAVSAGHAPAATARQRGESRVTHHVPLMASVTFIQAGSNRGVTGQTVEAFWNSISHVPLLSVGMNCALGPKEMRPLIEELANVTPIYVSCYPNAGLPNP